MKKIVLVAALAAISACSEPAPEATEEAPVEAAPAVAENIAADGLPTVGIYNVTSADGTTFSVDVKEDGTYAVTGADGAVTETGKWVQKSPELYCETPDTEGAVEKCYNERMENGVYLSTDPETGETSTITRPAS